MNSASSPNSNSLFSTRLISLYIISFLTGVSLGFFNPLISTLMEQRGINAIWVGANSTIYFLTIALVTPIIENLLRRIEIRRAMSLGLIFVGFSAPLFPLTSQIPLWFLIRIVMGFGVCGLLVGGQTALNDFCNKQNRSSVNGLYALALGAGFGIGPVIGPRLYQISPQLAFFFGGGVILSAVFVVWFGLPKKFFVSVPPRSFFIQTLSRLRYSIHGIFAYGFAEASLVSLYPLFLLRQNYSLAQMGNAFAVFVVGSIIGTLPVTYLADRFGKVKVLLFCFFFGSLSTLGLVVMHDFQWILGFSFWTGVCVGPIYPVCLALVGEQLPKTELSSGTALFTTTYSFGCASGPIFSSIMMQAFGDSHLFSLSIPLYLILVARMWMRPQKLKKPSSLTQLQ
ncbi:MAG: MFS transporter [Scytonema sp. PMC 1069.18]|nr:MFS transporter [Scytonema sp. PMC 1069.18]MEC4885421.1 MFS transporter [Scytonema sp. PMC 1070.18]